jgi:UDP-N-acetylglucosamine 4-epimerase
VVGFDNFATGSRANVDRVARAGGPDFRFVEGDIRDRAQVSAAVAGAGRVVHLAAQVSVPRSIEDPQENDSVNVGGFLNVLAEAARAGVRGFVYASSCAVYGDNAELPLIEEACPRPLSPYAASKLINEHYATTLAPGFPDMAVVGLRLFNIYGPWQGREGGYASVIPKWLAQCLAGERPELYGDGTATRDFCFVADVARAVDALATLRRPPHAVYNIGTGTAIDMVTLFAAIAAAAREHGRSLDFDAPRQEPPRPGDIVHSRADIGRAEAAFGFAPAVGLADGLRRMIAEEYAGAAAAPD